MSTTKNEETVCQLTGVDNAPNYRRTLGLPMMRVLSPEDVEREKRRKSLNEGSLSLAELNRRVAVREEADKLKSPEQRRRERIVEGMLSTGKNLCLQFGFKPQRPDLNWFQLRAGLKDFSDVEIRILSIAFLGLPKPFQEILSREYSIGFFNFKKKKQGILKSSETEITQALKKLMLHIVCILAYKDDAKSKVGKTAEAAGSGDDSSHTEKEDLKMTNGDSLPAPPQDEVGQNVFENIPGHIETFHDRSEDEAQEKTPDEHRQFNSVHPEQAESFEHRIYPYRYRNKLSLSRNWNNRALREKEIKEVPILTKEKSPMDAIVNREIPADVINFLDAVTNADLANEETVRDLLSHVSFEDLKKDLGFEISIDQLIPLCLTNHSDRSLRDSQARNFFIFFGRGGLSVGKLAPHLKNTSAANVFAQKKAAIRRLQKFAHTDSAPSRKSVPPVISPESNIIVTPERETISTPLTETRKFLAISKLIRNSVLQKKTQRSGNPHD
ncbi:MAG TPA: hypothetical protein VK254_02990 [Candidatus Bathyarchaeia archaeon]|nr:hypothetical protein [Candidatus Bathyarchaeia archaeon]